MTATQRSTAFTKPPLLKCNRCKSFGPTELKWKEYAGGNRHLGVYCGECGSWIKWLAQR